MINRLTEAMRDVLIEHLDGRAVPVVVVAKNGLDGPALGRRQQVVQAMVERGYLKQANATTRHPFTTITDKGRARLSEALANWADALVRARHPFFDPTGQPWRAPEHLREAAE